MTYKTTTFPSQHSTPNHEQGLLPSPLLFQLAKAPKGSVTTLSLNPNNAIPASKHMKSYKTFNYYYQSNSISS